MALDAVAPMLAQRFDRLERALDDLVVRLADHAPTRLMTWKDVATFLRIDQRTLQRMVASGRFPNPIPISQARSCWRRCDVEAWLDGRRESS